MTTTINDFLQLKNRIDPTQVVRVDLAGKIFTGEFRTVYDKISKLAESTRFNSTSKLTFTQLNQKLELYVLEWLDELPNLLAAAETYYSETDLSKEERTSRVEKWHKIVTYYNKLYFDLESLSVEIDSYLDGQAEEPDIEEMHHRVVIMRMLAQPDLLRVDWFDSVTDEEHLAAIEVLLWAGQDINAVNIEGKTALQLACENNCEQVVELLLKYEASTDTIDNNRTTPLHVATLANNQNIVSKLLAANADTRLEDRNTETAFDIAVNTDNVALAKMFLDYGTNPNMRGPFNNTVLLRASSRNQLQMVKLLLDHGADPNIANNRGVSPLYEASKNGHVDVVRLLVEYGAQNIRIRGGQTPLDVARLYGYAEIVGLLDVA